jgi:hypothetical protein
MSQFGKEELVHLHLVLFQIKKAFELLGFYNEYFADYDSLGISPVQIYRQKKEHKEAIIDLCMGIMKAINRESEAIKLCNKAVPATGQKRERQVLYAYS